MAKTTRLLNGEGPEVTVPDWRTDSTPAPDEWLDWFLVQSREAQIVIATYHLDVEARFNRVRNAMSRALADGL
jgi:hypothetical protein